jgi:hypothetical protein
MNHSIFKARFDNIFVPQVHLRWKGLPEKAVLLLHNVSVYPNEHVLKFDNCEVSVKYLPPDGTTLIQPMNRRTTATMKRHYGLHVLQKHADKGNDLKMFLKKLFVQYHYELPHAWNTIK